MHERKRYSPGGALFALAILIVLQGSDEGHPSGVTAHPPAPAVHRMDASQARQTLPVGHPARLERSQPPSWVF